MSETALSSSFRRLIGIFLADNYAGVVLKLPGACLTNRTPVSRLFRDMEVFLSAPRCQHGASLRALDVRLVKRMVSIRLVTVVSAVVTVAALLGRASGQVGLRIEHAAMELLFF